MSAVTRRILLPLVVTTVAITMLAGATGAQAKSFKLILASQFGREVNLTEAGKGPELEDICTVASGKTCQKGKESTIAGGFEFPKSVAVAASGNVYVADARNNRIQELEASGKFVLMFGWHVNETKVNEVGGGTPTPTEVEEENICPRPSKLTDKCKAGESGGLAGQMEGPQDVAVDQTTGNVYVFDLFNWRVEEYTSGGQFVLTIGREVNETAHLNHETANENICPGKAGDKCEAGVKSAPGSTEHSAFKPKEGNGNLLAVGPAPEHLLYVGDEQRVQEFEGGGKWKREISLTSISAETESKVAALAVDGNGDVYLVYRHNFTNLASVVREFNPSGAQIKEFDVTAREANGQIEIIALALDSAGGLAMIERETYNEAGNRTNYFGSVLDDSTGKRLGEFNAVSGPIGLAFNGSSELYAANVERQDIALYGPVPVAELVTNPVPCTTSSEPECTLKGEVNPEGVSETEALFEYGNTEQLGSTTPVQHNLTGNVFVPVSAVVKELHPSETLRPNETYYYRIAGYDHYDQPPERALTSETAKFTTPSVPPEPGNEPEAAYITHSSAVLFESFNPENAKTTYLFEYGPCEDLSSCSVKQETAAAQSAAYGMIGVALNANGLAPSTTYRYRLVAQNEPKKGGKEQAYGTEGSFTTPPAPSPSAVTGPASNVTATSATLSGTVDPDGAGATYAFQVGIYNGASTVYGTVASGPTGSEAGPVAEGFTLTGLQSGMTYAYRVTISSAYGTSIGEPTLFTTAGLPTVLFSPSVLAQLPVPNIAFPKEPGKVTPKKLTRTQQLTNALKVCRKKESKRQRTSCERTARKKYGAKPKKKK